ncbi:MAG: hypothetical protein HOH14_02920 [Gammaproteobacteria bacterium]|jgi:putative transcriptional regulator|nr:hypothetical protein [Gammaproteobacteria bacterium]MBT6042427.1 hypothetical protein [Gammaproteobacteria bacterium]
MTKYHPDTRFLTDYSAGSLPESQALCVAAHLHYCPACRTKVSELTQVGSEIFLSQEREEVSEDCFDRIMAKLSDLPATDTQSESSTSASLAATGQVIEPEPAKDKYVNDLPRAIQKLTGGSIEKMRWRKIGKSFRYSDINMGDDKRETSLLHIKAGGNVPKHQHGGDEITVILKGSFSDQEDHYHVGDYIVRTSGEMHTPVASQDEDCLCLATLDAPIVMNNWFYRLLAPLF